MWVTPREESVWLCLLTIPFLVLTPAGATATTGVYKVVTVRLVEVVVVDGPDDRLADETVYWEARARAEISGIADALHVTAPGMDGDDLVLDGVPE